MSDKEHLRDILEAIRTPPERSDELIDAALAVLFDGVAMTPDARTGWRKRMRAALALIDGGEE